jgi:hypothetical protein
MKKKQHKKPSTKTPTNFITENSLLTDTSSWTDRQPSALESFVIMRAQKEGTLMSDLVTELRLITNCIGND